MGWGAGSKGSVKIRDAATLPPPAVVRGMMHVSSLPRGIARASIARRGTVAWRSSSLGAAGTLPASPSKPLVMVDLAAREESKVFFLPSPPAAEEGDQVLHGTDRNAHKVTSGSLCWQGVSVGIAPMRDVTEDSEVDSWTSIKLMLQVRACHDPSSLMSGLPPPNGVQHSGFAAGQL